MLKTTKKKFMNFPLLLLFPLISSCSSVEASDAEKRLSPCPSSPNCVISSVDIKDSHYIEPISTGTLTKNEVHDRLIKIIEKHNGKILVDEIAYIKAEFLSKVFKFSDIAEFSIVPENNEILLKSAAQTGWYDFRVNRKRIESIRKDFSN